MEGEYSGHSDRLALMTVMADDKLSEKVAVDGPSIVYQSRYHALLY